MTDEESSEGGKFSYRTPFYQKLKQLNTDICTFMVQAKGINPQIVKKKKEIVVEGDSSSEVEGPTLPKKLQIGKLMSAGSPKSLKKD
jgi:hypothetical protein